MTDTAKDQNSMTSSSVGLTFNQLQIVFPFHIRIDSSFIITQVGKRLGNLFPINETTGKPICIGKHINDFFNVLSPSRIAWNYNILKMSCHMTFSFDLKSTDNMTIKKLPLIGGIVVSNPKEDPCGDELSALFLLNLRVKYTDELHTMGYGWSDLTPYGFQKELILTAESLKKEIDSSQKLENLTKSLKEEKSKTMVRTIFLKYTLLV